MPSETELVFACLNAFSSPDTFSSYRAEKFSGHRCLVCLDQSILLTVEGKFALRFSWPSASWFLKWASWLISREAVSSSSPMLSGFSLQFLGPLLYIPSVCCRYYVAEGVRIYSQESWRLIAGERGADLVKDNIDNMVSSVVAVCLALRMTSSFD